MALSLNSVTISVDNILELEPVTYKSIFFSLDSPNIKSTKEITFLLFLFASLITPFVGLVIPRYKFPINKYIIIFIRIYNTSNIFIKF